MERRKIAFLYNTRHRYPDPDDPASQKETDFDDPETIRGIGTHLEACGYALIPIEADERAYEELSRRRSEIDIALNYSMGIHGAARYAHLPAMLEMLQIPYTGSDPLTQGLVMNKAKLEKVLAADGVPVLRSQVFRGPEEELRPGLEFPLMVKPVAQGSSAGITSKSIVKDLPGLRDRVADIVRAFEEPALVQPFLEGREFSVPMLGNPPRILPFIEPDFRKLPAGFVPIDSIEVKWFFEEQSAENHLSCPAALADGERKRIEAILRAAWDALGIRDWCRIDVRCDGRGNPYVLDVNSPPGIIPPEVSMTSYFPLSARAAGISYDQLLMELIETARVRCLATSRTPRLPSS
jgi:D-alanine-D-alanine ligase